MSAPTPSVPAPRQLSDEERALWEKARMVIATRCGAHAGAHLDAVDAYDDATAPESILSLLTALSSEREAGERDKADATRWLFVRKQLQDGGTMYDAARQRRHCSLRLPTNIGAYFPSDGRVVTADEIVDAARLTSTERTNAR